MGPVLGNSTLDFVKCRVAPPYPVGQDIDRYIKPWIVSMEEMRNAQNFMMAFRYFMGVVPMKKVKPWGFSKVFHGNIHGNFISCCNW